MTDNVPTGIDVELTEAEREAVKNAVMVRIDRLRELKAKHSASPLTGWRPTASERIVAGTGEQIDALVSAMTKMGI